jgi:protein gp37
MGEKSEIAWTQNTWNPWQGCHKVSPGCKFCYMYRDKERYGQDPKTVVRSKPPTFNAPLKWSEPALVFTCSWSDWFVEEGDQWRDEAWAIIKATPHLTYQILTKRPERIVGHLPADWGEGYPNVWLGTSVESQKYANERIPMLIEAPARIKFLSCEPLLGPLDLEPWLWQPGYVWDGFDDVIGEAEPSEEIDWVITGGESGSRKDVRPAQLDWFRSIRDQCIDAEVAYFHKQHGGSMKVDGVWGGRVLDGITWDQMPERAVEAWA